MSQVETIVSAAIACILFCVILGVGLACGMSAFVLIFDSFDRWRNRRRW